ncbi:DUF5309 family protein [uncultured Muribaculum sp.]|uniref:SU10 major capsid protein n=1 Tax=uncultured Muribaculum sp. TaxID=1918613 RepID=UPI0025E1ABEB|nr:DUF5309 family protein [uncultured Muribaculum sp.]
METASTTHAEHVLDRPLTVAEVETIDNGFMLPDIDRRILKIRPMATPVDQISRSARPRTTASMEVQYFSVDNRPSSSEVSQIADAENNEFTISFKNKLDGKAFSRTDTVLLTGALAGGKPHTFYVTAAEGRALTAVYIGPDKEYALPADTEGVSTVVRMGRAAAELDVQTPQTTFVPKPDHNFCQIFKAQVENGALLAAGLKKADMSFTDQQEAAIIDMRMGMERNFLFGSRKKMAGPDGNTYFTRGIWDQAAREFIMPASLTGLDFIEMCRQAFTGHGGSARKVLIGGSKCVKNLVSPSKDSTVKQVGSVETEVHWGLNLKVISSNFGTLYVVHSETFDLCGHESDGMIIDPEYLQKYTHIPFSALRLDLKRSGQRNSDAVVLTEASCLVLRYPEAHMRLIGAKA